MSTAWWGEKKQQQRHLLIIWLWSLLRETALSYDVSLVLPRDSQSNWLIESQNVYLPGFIHFYYLIDFPVSWLWKYISEWGQLDSHSKEKFFGSDT